MIQKVKYSIRFWLYVFAARLFRTIHAYSEAFTRWFERCWIGEVIDKIGEPFDDELIEGYICQD